MANFAALLAAVSAAVAIVSAAPNYDPHPKHYNVVRQLSLPGSLIPGLGNLTEGLTKNLPDGIILQPPTPPLPTPEFTESDLKPKKIGYFWTGSNDRQHADFLAAYSLDDDTFGTFLSLAEVPTSGNEPHHSGPSVDGKTIWGGGLLSLLKTQDSGFFFDTTNPYRPKFKKSNRAALASIADEVRAKADGGFFFTYMGSAAGTSPGRLIETNSDGDIIGQWPESLDTLNVLSSQFSPHGLSIDWERNWILTSDFVVPLSVLKPSTGIQRANSLRLWNLEKREVVSTIIIPEGGGIQDVKFIPGNKDGAAIATAVHLGQVWIIYPNKKDPKTGKQGTAELLYDLGPKARDTTAIYTDFSKDGRFLYGTLTTTNHVFVLDLKDLKNIKRLDDPDEDQGILGPHYIKVTPDQKHLIVTDYFVETGSFGILNTVSDYRAVQWDLKKDGSLGRQRSIDFTKPYQNRGGARPHSVVVYDFTDPKNPLYY